MFDSVCKVILKFRCQRFGLDICSVLGNAYQADIGACVDTGTFVCGVGQFNSRDLREYSIFKCVFRKQQVKKQVTLGFQWFNISVLYNYKTKII